MAFQGEVDVRPQDVGARGSGWESGYECTGPVPARRETREEAGFRVKGSDSRCFKRGGRSKARSRRVDK